MTSIAVAIISVLVTSLMFTIGLLIKQASAYADLKSAKTIVDGLLQDAKTDYKITLEVMRAVKAYVEPHKEVSS